VQLFKKPHPQKKLSLRGGLPAAATQLGFFVTSAANDRLFFHNVDNLRPSMQPLKGDYRGCAVYWLGSVLAARTTELTCPNQPN